MKRNEAKLLILHRKIICLIKYFLQLAAVTLYFFLFINCSRFGQQLNYSKWLHKNILWFEIIVYGVQSELCRQNVSSDCKESWAGGQWHCSLTHVLCHQASLPCLSKQSSNNNSLSIIKSFLTSRTIKIQFTSKNCSTLFSRIIGKNYLGEAW